MPRRRTPRTITRSRTRNFKQPTPDEIKQAESRILDSARRHTTELHRDSLATDRERDLLTVTLVERVMWNLKDELS